MVNEKLSNRTSNSLGRIELSVYIHNFSAVKGMVSFIFDAKNMQVAPSNCNLVFFVGSTDKNLSK